MSKLTKKSLLFLSYNFIYWVNNLSIVCQSEPERYDFVCDDSSTYTETSAFKTNLDRTLTDLPTTNSGYGFFENNSGQDPDKANSIALCRGDIERDPCLDCVNKAIVNLTGECPNQKNASVYYDICMVKYSQEDILSKIGMDDRPVEGARKEGDITFNAKDVDSFNHDLTMLMSDLTSRASSGGPLRKFAADSRTWSDSSKIFGLVQCVPDLTEQQCSDCLTEASGRLAVCCNGSLGGRVLFPLCNLRYENSLFYGEAAPLPPPPPPPPPGTLPFYTYEEYPAVKN